ncbi:MAG: DnaJ domain-containing protein [Pleurocapsa sp.]
MSFAIKHGLFRLNIIDHHAVLGVSLDAEPKQIRLRYLKIAQKLHPDKCRSDAARMNTAGQILSKLVNPAYEQLSRKTTFAEQQLILAQIGKHLVENKAKISVKSAMAQELLTVGDSVELVYPKLLKKLAGEQYKSLEQIVKEIEAISELNLVYLLLKSDRAINRNVTSASEAISNTKKPTIAKNKTTLTPSPPSSKTRAKIEEPTSESRVAAFVNRAQQYISKGEFDSAIQELRDALKIDPNHGIVHAVMGRAYLHQKQWTMAKVYIDKAWKAEPHNQIVMESKKAYDKLANKSKISNPGSVANANPNHQSAKSGFFSRIFRPKKK